VSLEQIFFKGHAMTCFLIQLNLNTASYPGMKSKFYCYLLCYYYYYYHYHHHLHHRLFISGNTDSRKRYRKPYCSQLFLTSAIWRHTVSQICTGHLSHPLSIVLPSSRRYRVMEGEGFLRNVSIYLTGRTALCPINQLSIQSTPQLYFCPKNIPRFKKHCNFLSLYLKGRFYKSKTLRKQTFFLSFVKFFIVNYCLWV